MTREQVEKGREIVWEISNREDVIKLWKEYIVKDATYLSESAKDSILFIVEEDISKQIAILTKQLENIK